jgi:hypothetical protein
MATTGANRGVGRGWLYSRGRQAPWVQLLRYIGPYTRRRWQQSAAPAISVRRQDQAGPDCSRVMVESRRSKPILPQVLNALAATICPPRQRADRALRASAPGRASRPSVTIPRGRKTKGLCPWRMTRGRARALGRSRIPSLPRFACADRAIPHGCVRPCICLPGLADGQRFSAAFALKPQIRIGVSIGVQI